MVEFDVSPLSDDALLDRIAELSRRIVWASKFSGGGTVPLLQNQKFQCENALRERRMAGYVAARVAAPSIVIETDPDLAAQHRLDAEAEAIRLKPPTNRPKPFGAAREKIERIKPTATPVVPKTNYPIKK